MTHSAAAEHILVRRRHDSSVPKQIYWQEQVHVLSARELVTNAASVRVATIAGRPRMVHPALPSE
jgi:hypothetical protein